MERTCPPRHISDDFVQALCAGDSLLYQVGANQPLLLHDVEHCWLVVEGSVDLFLVPVDEAGEPGGPRDHIVRLMQGALMFGVSPEEVPAGYGLLVVCTPQTQVLSISRLLYHSLLQPSSSLHSEALAAIEDWVRALGLGGIHTLPPKHSARLSPGATSTFATGQLLLPRKQTRWLRLESGRWRWLADPDEPSLEDLSAVALPPQVWLQHETSQGTLHTLDPRELIEDDGLWDALQRFHGFFLRSLLTVRKQRHKRDQSAIQQQFAQDQRHARTTLEELQSLFSRQQTPQASSSQDPLFSAYRIIAQRTGLPLPPLDEDHAPFEDVEALRKRLQCRVRQVALRGAWWRGDHGPLLGYLQESQDPVALLPERGQYTIFNPQTQLQTPLGEHSREQLEPFAYTFYPPLPERPLGGKDLLRFAYHNGRVEWRNILLIVALLSLFGALWPLSIASLVESTMTSRSASQLFALTSLLVGFILGFLILCAALHATWIRLEQTLGHHLQTALWDRLLRLPLQSLREQSASGLASLSLELQTLQTHTKTLLFYALPGGLLLLVSCIILLSRPLPLAWPLLGTLLLFFSLHSILQVMEHKQQLRSEADQGLLAAWAFQLLSGINNIRFFGAEPRTFSRWSQTLAQQQKLSLQAKTLTNLRHTLQVFCALGLLFLLFATIAEQKPAPHLAGLLLTALFALVQLVLAAGLLSRALPAWLGLQSTLRLLRPLLHPTPEVTPDKLYAGALAGEIEVNHVSFRYQPDGPLILQDVSLHINPGEFIAIVGPSGSGKSTLLRLLLGFETPAAGSIYYDDKDLLSLDVESVRQQTGVVLQDSQLLPGDIFSNIVGTAALSLQDAWDAARLAGIEQDIRAMPMQMHTVVSQGGGNLSGGQRQRLLIARALVHHPRILFFDEATSTLDNQTQQIVSQSLEHLRITRLVIAHRLNTIAHADRIIVLEHGRIAQSGTFQELIQQDGLFAQLAKRQMLSPH